MGNVSKQEFKYIALSVGFAATWFLAIIPKLLEMGVENANPYIQFLFFNIGLFIFLNIFLKARAGGSTRINVGGSLGVIALFMALDTFTPPFLVNLDGSLISDAVLSASGSDYIFGYLATNLGLSGVMVFVFTYVIMPTLLLFIAAHLVKNFVREL